MYYILNKYNKSLYTIKVTLVLLTSFTVWNSCTEDIEIDLPEYETKIVVDGWIETSQPANIFLTQSSPYFTEYDSANIRQLFINTAKITLSCSDGESEVLTLFKQDEFFPPFIYKSIKIKGEENKSYQIKVETQGKVISAETSIPAKPDVNEIKIDLASDTTTTITAFINGNAEKSFYYYSEIKIQNFDTQYHSSASPLFSNVRTNGTDLKHIIHRSNQPDPLNLFNIDDDRDLPRNEYHYTDSVKVKISCIDEISHNVLNGIHLDNFNVGNPFALVNQKTETNINGGIGRWTGKASRSYFMYIKK